MGYQDENIRRIEELEARIDDLVADRDEERRAKAWEIFKLNAADSTRWNETAVDAFDAVDSFYTAERTK